MISKANCFPSNVVNSVGEPLLPETDTLFLARVFAHLAEKIPSEFERLTFVVHRRVFGEFAGKAIRLDPGGPDRILIVISDEREAFPYTEFLSYRLVFHAYGNPAGGTTRIHPFPVGYMEAAGLADTVPFDERTTSVFFSGYLNRNRIDLLKQFRKIWWLPRRNLPKNRYIREIARRAVEKLIPERSFDQVFHSSLLGFTEWFAKGLPQKEYAEVLANTKIAICPPGFDSHETIRHWEALRLGCVVISAPLPPNRFYKDSPIIQLNDWSELRAVLTDLLDNPKKLESVHLATLAWWNNICSEDAVADYMIRTLTPNT